MLDLTETPPWFDDLFLDQVIQSVENTKEKANVKNLQIKPAVPPGSNYLSNLYRVRVEYSTCHSMDCSIAFIVKKPLDSGSIKEFVDSVDGYGREVYIYQHVLPKMYELHTCKVTANTLFSPINQILVLEDLGAQGYKMANRLQQLDKAHCRKALQSIAKLHAFSVALQHSKPELIVNLGDQLRYREDKPDREEQEGYLKYGLNAMLLTVKKLPGCERFVKKIENKIDSFYNIMVKLSKVSDRLNVMNHGDAWTNNILFKYSSDSGEVLDAKLVDFQMSLFGSFAYDLQYFWWSSTNNDVRDLYKDELFEVYRQTLNHTLKEINCPERLSKENFDYDMKNYSPLAIWVVSGVLAIFMADPEDLLDLNELDDEEFKKPLTEDSTLSKNYRSKYYKAILPNILCQLEQAGVLD